MKRAIITFAVLLTITITLLACEQNQEKAEAVQEPTYETVPILHAELGGDYSNKAFVSIRIDGVLKTVKVEDVTVDEDVTSLDNARIKLEIAGDSITPVRIVK